MKACLGVLLALLWSVIFDSSAQAEPRGAANSAIEFERDRLSILAMAGTYSVQFDMRETVPFVSGYKPLPPKLSGGLEVVKVVEDQGNVISLQHLLLAGESRTTVIKHWRQTWIYEPRELLVYSQSGEWTLQRVQASVRKGAWSQTVWQTDDSPRYGGIGRWQYLHGVASWSSGPTLRPLARRDAVRHPVYDRYLGTNRHSLTPSGWVHEQDNAKQGLHDDQRVTFVHEVVINSYVRAPEAVITAADEYWSRTQQYWAAVRERWTQIIRERRGVHLEEEAENGSRTGSRLMSLANQILGGELDTMMAVAAADQAITAATLH